MLYIHYIQYTIYIWLLYTQAHLRAQILYMNPNRIPVHGPQTHYIQYKIQFHRMEIQILWMKQILEFYLLKPILSRLDYTLMAAAKRLHMCDGYTLTIRAALL